MWSGRFYYLSLPYYLVLQKKKKKQRLKPDNSKLNIIILVDISIQIFLYLFNYIIQWLRKLQYKKVKYGLKCDINQYIY